MYDRVLAFFDVNRFLMAFIDSEQLERFIKKFLVKKVVTCHHFCLSILRFAQISQCLVPEESLKSLLLLICPIGELCLNLCY